MYTQCPHCQTLFRVHAQQLKAAHGWVRCCSCDEVFDALNTLQEDVGESAYDELPETVHEGQQMPYPDPVETDREARPLPFDLPPNLPELPTAVEGGYPHSGEYPDQPNRGWLWLLGVLILILVLLGQMAWLERERLIEHPQGRYVLEKLCQIWTAACDEPIWKDPEQIRILTRTVSLHPKIEGALLVKLVIANDAPFPQPYPLLRISLLDESEQLIARRKFTPVEYLSKQMRRIKLMASGESTFVELALADPGGIITGYRFDFF